MRAGQASDAGRVRSSNQDLALVGEHLVAVADGMGGHAGGEVAAQMAIDALAEGFSGHESPEGLREAAARANNEVYERGEADVELRGMGTTLTAAALVHDKDDDKIAVINVGDSRAYLFEDNKLVRVTSDHSLVEEMVRRGEISAEQALVHPHRHILTRALGIDRSVEIDSWLLSPGKATRLLLCSDGLTNECSEQEIAGVLAEEPDPQHAAQVLVELALEHGGGDNITIVVADVVRDEHGAPGPLATEIQVEQQSQTKLNTGPVRAGRPPARARAGGTAAGAKSSAVKAPGSKAATTVAARPRVRPVANRAESRVLTVRVALFIVILLALIGGIAGFTVWFNDASYFLGISKNSIAIFQGRPGGMLWFKPSLVEQSNLSTNGVLAANLPQLRAGMLEPSFNQAKQVEENLSNEKSLLGIVNGAPASTTTLAPTTTIPPTSAPVHTSTSLATNKAPAQAAKR